jgi:hypothetical protein
MRQPGVHDKGGQGMEFVGQGLALVVRVPASTADLAMVG